MSRRLVKRVVALTLAFTALAMLFGILQAPGYLQDIGALVGLIFGFPMALVLAFLVRKKPPLAGFAAITAVVIVLSILPFVDERLRNPFIYLAILFLAGVVLAAFLPNDKSLQDPSRCAGCDYPIGSSDVCTECGRAVRAKAASTRPV